jgi:hypothetical protein
MKNRRKEGKKGGMTAMIERAEKEGGTGTYSVPRMQTSTERNSVD